MRVSGGEEIRQGIQVKTLMMRGEVPTNLRLGFPWLVLLGKTDPAILGSRLRSRIASAPGVIDVTEFELSEEGDRSVFVTYTARASEAALAQALLVEDKLAVQG